MSTSVVPVSSDDAATLTGNAQPSSIIRASTLLVGGKTYFERPRDTSISLIELLCPSCCYVPQIVTYYADAASTVQIGEKNGKKCCCITMPPKPPKGELHPGYQIVGKGTLNPWKRPCCFCLQSTPMMVDPSTGAGITNSKGEPIPEEKTYYVPTAIVKDVNGTPAFETRIRSIDQNCCAGCKMCASCACCKPKCCGLACFSCCGPCCECCFTCSSCCKCRSCFGICKCFGPCFGPCKGCCEMGCPACYGCIWGTYGGEPTYTIENQPIFKPGKENKTPIGYIKSIWMENTPFSVTIDVPGATSEEQELLLILAYAIVEKTDPLDPSKIGFIHDQASNFTNPYFSTIQKGVKFDEVMKISTGGAPSVSEMAR